MAYLEYLATEIAVDHVDGTFTRREALRRLALLGLSTAAAGSLPAASGRLWRQRRQNLALHHHGCRGILDGFQHSVDHLSTSHDRAGLHVGGAAIHASRYTSVTCAGGHIPRSLRRS